MTPTSTSIVSPNVPEIARIRSFVEQQRHSSIVTRIIRRNVYGQAKPPTQDEVWSTLIECILGPRHRLDPRSPAAKFIARRPFSLALQSVSRAPNTVKYVRDELLLVPGITYRQRAARQICNNLQRLQSGAWDALARYVLDLLDQRSKPPVAAHYRLERRAARFITKTFEGMGAMQARNLLQSLGLTRFEFVLDARVVGWLRGLPWQPPIIQPDLKNEVYYSRVSDDLRHACVLAAVLPCVLDAAICSDFRISQWKPGAGVR